MRWQTRICRLDTCAPALAGGWEILVEAAETGANPVIRDATDMLLTAIETEGWITRQPIARDGQKYSLLARAETFRIR
jgi:hypothetical protein